MILFYFSKLLQRPESNAKYLKTMSVSKPNKQGDGNKIKGKFSSFNINSVYRGQDVNPRKEASAQQRSQHGLQSLGRVQLARQPTSAVGADSNSTAKPETSKEPLKTAAASAKQQRPLRSELDEITKGDMVASGWALAHNDELDYSAKIVFSDEEDDAKYRTATAAQSEQEPQPADSSESRDPSATESPKLRKPARQQAAQQSLKLKQQKQQSQKKSEQKHSMLKQKKLRKKDLEEKAKEGQQSPEHFCPKREQQQPSAPEDQSAAKIALLSNQTACGASLTRPTPLMDIVYNGPPSDLAQRQQSQLFDLELTSSLMPSDLHRRRQPPAQQQSVMALEWTRSDLRGADLALVDACTGKNVGGDYYRHISLITRQVNLTKKASLITKKASLITKEASLITKKASLITKEASLITKEASLITKKASLITKEASLITKKASLITKEASLITKKASLITKEASLITKKVSLISRKARLITRQASLITRQASLLITRRASLLITRRVSRITRQVSLLITRQASLIRRASLISRQSNPDESQKRQPRQAGRQSQTEHCGGCETRDSGVETSVDLPSQASSNRSSPGQPTAAMHSATVGAEFAAVDGDPIGSLPRRLRDACELPPSPAVGSLDECSSQSSQSRMASWEDRGSASGKVSGDLQQPIGSQKRQQFPLATALATTGGDSFSSYQLGLQQQQQKLASSILISQSMVAKPALLAAYASLLQQGTARAGLQHRMHGLCGQQQQARPSPQAPFDSISNSPANRLFNNQLNSPCPGKPISGLPPTAAPEFRSPAGGVVPFSPHQPPPGFQSPQHQLSQSPRQLQPLNQHQAALRPRFYQFTFRQTNRRRRRNSGISSTICSLTARRLRCQTAARISSSDMQAIFQDSQASIQANSQANSQVNIQAINQVNSQASIQASIQANIQAISQVNSQANIRASNILPSIKANIQASIQANNQANSQVNIQTINQVNIQASIQANIQARIQARIQASIQANIQAIS
uniref:BAT2_N domain-containing protein n=1 Tax=Macrostomum lignano TaxID=282301 RepID=A0A1I8HAV0_9PLAT